MATPSAVSDATPSKYALEIASLTGKNWVSLAKH